MRAQSPLQEILAAQSEADEDGTIFLHPREHLIRPLGCQIGILPLRLKFQHEQVGLLHRKTRAVFQSAVCTVP